MALTLVEMINSNTEFSCEISNVLYTSAQLSFQFQRVWHKIWIEEPELNADLVGEAKDLAVARDSYRRLIVCPILAPFPEYTGPRAALFTDIVDGYRASGDVVGVDTAGIPIPKVDQIRSQIRFGRDRVDVVFSSAPFDAELIGAVVIHEVYRLEPVVEKVCQEEELVHCPAALSVALINSRKRRAHFP